MEKTVSLHGKPLQVRISKTAESALEKLTAPLLAEIHLIFGCMVVKRVWFKERTDTEQENIQGNLNVCFRTVRYAKHCRISHIDEGTEEPSEFPIVADKKAFTPDWLEIDFKKNQWTGKYGFRNKSLPR